MEGEKGDKPTVHRGQTGMKTQGSRGSDEKLPTTLVIFLEPLLPLAEPPPLLPKGTRSPIPSTMHTHAFPSFYTNSSIPSCTSVPCSFVMRSVVPEEQHKPPGWERDGSQHPAPHGSPEWLFRCVAPFGIHVILQKRRKDLRWVCLFKVPGLDGSFGLACGLSAPQGGDCRPRAEGHRWQKGPDVAVDRCGGPGLDDTQSFLPGIPPGLGGHAGAFH